MSTPLPLQNTETEIEQAILEFDVGNIPAAVARAEQLVRQHPDNHPILCLAAAMAAAENRYPDAEKFYQRSLAVAQSAQDKAKSWAGLGKLAMLAGNPAAAEESARRAMLTDPTAVQHAIEFAEILAVYGKLDPAIDVLRSSMNRFPRDPDPSIALGSLLLKNGRHRDALAFYDMALQRDPNASAAHFNASVALTMLGKVDAARTACENALKISPEMSGYYQLANLGGLKADDPRIAVLESRAEDPRASRELRIDAGFALAAVFDTAGDADKAFPQLWRANTLKRSTLSYDICGDEDRIAKISSLFTADFLRRFAGASSSNLAPIFVLGMPRSGTTLLEQMLAGHSQVHAGGELPHMAEIARGIGILWGERGEASPGSDEQVRGDLEQAIREYTEATRPLQGKPHFTDKLPGNFMFIGLIHLMFPAARIIHCRRDPVDTCLSNYQRLFSSEVPYSYDLVELGQYHRLYQKLMQHWHAVLPAGRILDVDYEAVVADPEIELRRVLDFCGLGFEVACLDFHTVQRSISTASAVQIRSPLYGTSVRRWKGYAAHLQPLLAALQLEPTES
jgi:Flp pilus assembly protein TadD